MLLSGYLRQSEGEGEDDAKLGGCGCIEGPDEHGCREWHHDFEQNVECTNDSPARHLKIELSDTQDRDGGQSDLPRQDSALQLASTAATTRTSAREQRRMPLPNALRKQA